MSLTLLVSYNDAANFTLSDSNAVGIVGGKAVLRPNPNSAQFWANYDNGTSADADFAAGVLGSPFGIATLGGAAAVTAGKLDLRGSGRYVTYPAANNLTSFAQIATIRFKVTPAYSGSPSSRQMFLDGYRSDNASRLQLFHDTTGNVTLNAYTSAGVLNALVFGAWSPTAGTEYEIELDYEFTIGGTRLFLNGTQLGSTKTNSFLRGADHLQTIKIGNSRDNEYIPNFQIDDYTIFGADKHTADYTAPSPPEAYYSRQNPYLTTVSTLVLLDGLDSFSQVATTSGSDQVKYLVILDGVGKWWNGSSWVTSDGTYAQANTAAEILANHASLSITSGAALTLRAYLHAETNTSTPDLTSVTILYNFFSPTPTPPGECIVFGYLRDLLGDVPVVTNAKFVVENEKGFFNGSVFIRASRKTADVDSTGRFDISLVESASVSKTYRFSIQYMDDADTIKTEFLGSGTVPNEATKNIAAMSLSL